MHRVLASLEQHIRLAGWPGKLLDCYMLLGVDTVNTTTSQVPKNRGFGANIQFLLSIKFFRLEETVASYTLNLKLLNESCVYQFKVCAYLLGQIDTVLGLAR